jgi:hypothetical protein
MKGRINQIVLLLILFSANQLQPQITSHWNSDTSFYFYNSDSNAENLIASKVIYDSKLTKEEILDSVASYLSNTYFIPKHKYYEGKHKIIITLMDITSIGFPDRKYSIATVNIDDPDTICMGTYFQGSTGGFITFLMLVSNLIQPQLKTPLLDGLIILYNNTELKGMDHINLEGLISEREIDNLVRQAVKY